MQIPTLINRLRQTITTTNSSFLVDVHRGTLRCPDLSAIYAGWAYGFHRGRPRSKTTAASVCASDSAQSCEMLCQTQRMAVYEACSLLRKYDKEYKAVQVAMKRGASIAECVQAIESA